MCRAKWAISTMRILLVEDDTSLGETILAWLRLDQHAVDWVRVAIRPRPP
jgi:DNA-binding response OmpR family regulator